MAEWGDYLGINMADGNEPFGQEALQEIAAIAGVADDIDAMERLRAALVPMGREYRRIIAMVPSELKGAPGSESHSERLEWLDTQLLNPLKRLLPALVEERRYMFSMWPQEVRPPELPDWDLLIKNLEFLQNLTVNTTLAIAFYRHVVRHVDCAVVIEGVRTGFNRLEVVRIKREGEEWPPEQSWTAWFDRWRKRRER